MSKQIIQDKISELRELLEKELPHSAVQWELTLTADSTSTRVKHKSLAQLKKQGISMRNIKGEFINH